MSRKWIALLLAVLMLLATVSALADVGNVPIKNSAGEVIGYDYYEDGKLIQTERKVNGKTHWTDYDKNGNVTGTGVYTTKKNGTRESTYYDAKGTKLYASTGKYDKKGNLLEESGTSYRSDGSVASLNYSKGGNWLEVDPNGKVLGGQVSGKTFKDGKWYDGNNKETTAPDLEEYMEKLFGKPKKKDGYIWYGFNTCGVLGISLRENYPGLTSKWYHVLPVDVSRDGTQVFPLVASNMYYMGEVTVTVMGDKITTTFEYPMGRSYEIYPKDECLAWFRGVEEISSTFLENPSSDMQFGKAISRRRDLNGQQYGLLFICNHLTYRVPFNNAGAEPTRFWPNHPKLNEYYASARTRMQQMEAEYATTPLQEQEDENTVIQPEFDEIQPEETAAAGNAPAENTENASAENASAENASAETAENEATASAAEDTATAAAAEDAAPAQPEAPAAPAKLTVLTIVRQ